MKFDLTQRSAGILLHVTSLPGPWFNGDLGKSAYAFIDWLADAGQRWWQMLPVSPMGPGNSPYSTTSSFAGEPLLIDLSDLVRRGYLKKSECAKPPGNSSNTVDYKLACKFRHARLRTAYARAIDQLPALPAYQRFLESEKHWIEDYAMFGAIAGRLGTAWHQWPAELRSRDAAGLENARHTFSSEIGYIKFKQFIFQEQWQALRQYAAGKGVALMGDLPIFVAHGSADVWVYQDQFWLGPDGACTYVAGCPPDAFNKDGQLWGNALYRWDEMADDRFQYWIRRISRVFQMFDAVRLDHFIGFHRYWEIDAGARNARGGRWKPARGRELFAEMKRQLGDLPFVAEDLGAVVPEVRKLRDDFGFPGMKVLQFGFDGSEEAVNHIPHKLPVNAVAYTGTHDNNTTRGWYRDLMQKARSGRNKSAVQELDQVTTYLGTSERTVHVDMTRAAYMSQAAIAIIPVQDLLGLTGKDRMNIPGEAEGNWRFRLPPGLLDRKNAQFMKKLTTLFDRA